MPLPSNALKNVEVESKVYPGRVYVLRPALIDDRPSLTTFRIEGTEMAEQIRSELHIYRRTMDLSDHFSPEECEQIRELSMRQTQDVTGELDDDELNLILQADRWCVIKDKTYREMAQQTQEWALITNLKVIAYLLIEVKERDESFIPDDHDATVAWLKELQSSDFNGLIAASNDMSLITPETEKNLEPQPISD